MLFYQCTKRISRRNLFEKALGISKENYYFIIWDFIRCFSGKYKFIISHLLCASDAVSNANLGVFAIIYHHTVLSTLHERDLCAEFDEKGC